MGYIAAVHRVREREGRQTYSSDTRSVETSASSSCSQLRFVTYTKGNKMRLSALLAAGAALARAQEVVKIMPLGDSITGSPVRPVPLHLHRDARRVPSMRFHGERNPVDTPHTSPHAGPEQELTIPGLLARPPLARPPRSRRHKHRLRRHPPLAGLRIRPRRRQRGPRRVPGDQHRQRGAAAGVAREHGARRGDGAPCDQ